MPEPHLFRPFPLRGVTFRNRVFLSPMCQYEAREGHVTPWHFAHHGRFALGGVGGALVEATAVTPEGRITPGCLGIWNDAHVEGLKHIVDIYHMQGVPIGIQLAHAGRKASAARPWDGAGPLQPGGAEPPWTAIAPSAQAHTDTWPQPKAMDRPAIDALVQAFAAATRRALAAGFDFVEIHGAHGYLIHSFLSPLANHREDAYGGSFENRMRLAIEIAAAARAELPPTSPLLFRASAVDGVDGGLEIEDTVELARALKAVGVDLIDCSSGGIRGPSAASVTKAGPGFQVPYAAAVRHGAGVPTMAVGLITEARQAEAILDRGDADLIAIGRELLADSNFAYRAGRELGLADPHNLLPRAFAFYLERRRPQLPR